MNNVYSLAGAEDPQHPEDGIPDWHIYFTPGLAKTLDHQVARDWMMTFLAQVRAAGWQRYIEADAPRLSGKQAWRYVLSKDTEAQDYSLDSSCTPTMDEWKDMTTHDLEPHWVFQVNGAYLIVTLTGDGANDAQGHYRAEAEIDNEYKFYDMAYSVDGKKRMKIKGAWPAMVKEGHRILRNRKEARLKALGYTIDASYRNPPVKAPEIPPDSTGH